MEKTVIPIFETEIKLVAKNYVKTMSTKELCKLKAPALSWFFDVEHKYRSLGTLALILVIYMSLNVNAFVVLATGLLFLFGVRGWAQRARLMKEYIKIIEALEDSTQKGKLSPQNDFKSRVQTEKKKSSHHAAHFVDQSIRHFCSMSSKS